MIIQQMGVILKTSKLNNENLAYRFKLSRMHNNWTGRTKEKIVLESQKKEHSKLSYPNIYGYFHALWLFISVWFCPVSEAATCINSLSSLIERKSSSRSFKKTPCTNLIGDIRILEYLQAV
jgi:hypothetical protein